MSSSLEKQTRKDLLKMINITILDTKLNCHDFLFKIKSLIDRHFIVFGNLKNVLYLYEYYSLNATRVF